MNSASICWSVRFAYEESFRKSNDLGSAERINRFKPLKERPSRDGQIVGLKTYDKSPVNLKSLTSVVTKIFDSFSLLLPINLI